MISIILGGAGFVGTNLIGRLIQEGQTVVVLDNFSRGQKEYSSRFIKSNNFHIFECEASSFDNLHNSFSLVAKLGGIDEVWHLAANSDIPAGVNDPCVDFKDTFLTTFELLRVMKIFEIKKVHFASSSAIYGNLGDITLHESVGPLLPISNYGAMKLASEGLISAAAESFLNKANIFRFPNVVGVPATHGVLLDFIMKLKKNPSRLDVLGDGTQQKAYLHVSDLVDAMLVVSKRADAAKVEVINIGPVDEGVTVDWISRQVVKRVSPDAKILFGTGNRGWVGDVPKFTYSTEKLQSYGWKPELNSADAIKCAIDEIALQFGK
ncbi:NAD-dependent epimerase/dehydratase family protein [Polynucleobacter sp. 30F-ANTBAC]|uniref:NAD-dependent epimerase/dehydratase family protein n=1 Tax=Polynucleobacter sp. 30F-ANTBAC TaxID=2689095 RepID=UPI001C0CF46C|nr:NAD-dependent epimerase/dehydratase family protein [Polynucleobacter sp. 30F-ANTBAC]MBU3599653.1 NAD-dependent epimerase/dehydratase family protein [Polynucleobacter sp. 30F-ANTBAC]